MTTQLRLILVAGIAVVALVVASLWWFAAHNAKPPAAPVQGALPAGFVAITPPVQVGDLGVLQTDGKRVTCGDFKGRPVLLNVWAKWCAP